MSDTPRVERLLGRYGGLLVAGLGFVITRFFVAETVTTTGDPLVIAATVGPLVVGLAMSVFGVALAVGAFRPAYVADVTVGCLVGSGAMVVVLIVTAAGGGFGMLTGGGGPQLLVANVLLAGAIGGIVNGIRRSAARRRREEVAWNANRARFINRLLRHEVLNAAAIADGHAEQLRRAGEEARDRSVDAIRRATDRIESTVNGVGRIAEGGEDTDGVPLAESLDRALDTEAVEPAKVDLGDLPPVEIAADDRIATAFEALLTNAIDGRSADEVAVRVDRGRHGVTVVVEDDGEPLSAAQRDLLERSEFPEYDDPTSGFDLQMASLLVAEYGGRVEVGNGERTRIELWLPRARSDRVAAAVGVTSPNLKRAGVAGVGAGVVMGVLFWAVSGLLPVIGSLYGVHDPSIGWVTHLFHSVVFALLFVAAGSSSRLRDRVGTLPRAAVGGVVWGAVLWLFAAGVIMPLWLQGVGMEAPLPNLPAIGLLTHTVWGLTLGAGYVAIGGRFE